MTIRQVDRRFRSAVLAAVDETVDGVAGGIERRVPRDTGGLAATLAVEHAHPAGEIIAGSVSIGSRDHPAGPVEFGTAEMAPQPSFRPSIHPAGADLPRSLQRRFLS